MEKMEEEHLEISRNRS